MPLQVRADICGTTQERAGTFDTISDTEVRVMFTISYLKAIYNMHKFCYVLNITKLTEA